MLFKSLFGASLMTVALISSSSADSDSSDSSDNEFNYDGECDGYDNAYQIGISRYNDEMGDSVAADGVTTFLTDPNLGQDALQVGYGGTSDGYDVDKRFFCTNDDNDNTKIYLEGYGFPLSTPVTAWLVCPPAGRTHSLFQDGEDGILAEWQVPAQPTTAAYTSGRGYDANSLEVDSDRTMKYEVALDFNPTHTMQTPLPNRRATVLQSEFPDEIGSEAEGGLYTGLKQNTFRDSGAYQDIAREFLRYFNEDGSQVLDDNGRPELVRSPCAHTILPLVGHTDFLTHGTDAAIFYRFHMEEYERGDHFWVAVMDLSALTEINLDSSDD